MEYVPVRVSTLRGDQKINFDIYIQLRDKFIHYIRQGHSFEGKRLNRLKDRKLKKMYIPAEHEEFYQSYIRANLDIAYDKSSGRSLEDRSEIVQGMNQAAAEEVLESPESEGKYFEAKNSMGRYATFLEEDDLAMKAVLSIENTDKNLAHHGLSVSTLAVSLVRKLGLTEDLEKIKQISLGALLHDIGHTMHDLDLTQGPESMSPLELKIYKQHAGLGAEKVDKLKHFDKTVINIIAQHEEHIDGSGHYGVKKQEFDVFAQVVGLANTFDRHVLTSGMSHQEALKEVNIHSLAHYELDHINALKELLKEKGVIK